ncbi:GspE/PulE family protein [Stieleria marina]|uniref:Type II secretion system protein E n=1 Tax=Stieleria marina TaxID=1930275 RepID=A0A517NY52_9BACT|nr:Putative type II secretion system protein E [Planctomycetes bacterium K23_9]
MKTIGLDQLYRLDPADEKFAVDAVDLLLAAAVDSGASDLHLHPRHDGWEILFRIDGVLSLSHHLVGGGANNPVTRLMVLAGLPTYRSSQPMEGRVKWEHRQADDLSMRLGVFPTVHGPRGVVRFLKHKSTFSSIDSLGLSQDVADELVRTCDETDGAIFLSGPAGSGKTTTLYALLRRIAAASPRRSVMTIEDPVESILPAISQSELDPSGGMTLAAALRSAVRQDSEVLLVSEIRDPETAEAAFQASLTGHLVFSSLHASDVAASLRRLVQFGVPVPIVQSGIRTIVSQRLLRKLCTTCRGVVVGSRPQVAKVAGSVAATAFSEDANLSGDKANLSGDKASLSGDKASVSGDKACPDCLGTRYKGRIPIAQCVRLDGHDRVGDALIASLSKGDSLSAMRIAAVQAGGTDLRQRASSLVDASVTDQQEVYRVLGREPG